MDMPIIPANKNDIINLINNQIDIINRENSSPTQLSRNQLFNIQGKWINNFVKKNLSYISLKTYRFCGFRYLINKILLITLIGLVFFNMMWGSYFSRARFGKSWHSFNDFQILLLKINGCLTLLIIIAIVVFYLYTRLNKGVEKRVSKRMQAVFSYEIFLKELIKKIENLSSNEIEEMLRNHLKIRDRHKYLR